MPAMDDKWLDMDCMDIDYWQRQTERFPASTYVWVMFRRAKALSAAQLPTSATPDRSEQTDFRALAVRVLRQHRRCGDAYPEDGWPEVNAALAQYALEKRYLTVSAASQGESRPKGDMPENEDVVDMVSCALCKHPISKYCSGCVEFSNFEPREKEMSKKMCEICGIHPATVPDRERIGRLINRVCGQCHVLRLAGDLERILTPTP